MDLVLPKESPLLYKAARAYVDRYRSENNDDMHTNGELAFLTRVLPHCQLVFDIGANIGDWANLALGIKSQLDLHCFEPSRRTYEKLVGNNFPKNVVCNNFGLSSVPSDKQLVVFGDESGLNSLYRRPSLELGWGIRREAGEETVHLDTCDAYIEKAGLRRRIDLCKIDVEGHELEVLRGMSAALRDQQIGMIQFEYGGCNIDSRVFLKDIFNFLQPLDYQMFKIYPRKLRHVSRYDETFENFQYQNWVAVPKESLKADLATTSFGG